jgi:hypothetical protein
MRNAVFDKYIQHVGHKIEVVYYGPKLNPVNVAIECVDCDLVLTDENPEIESEE